MEWLFENWPSVISAATSIVGGFALIATMTPNKSDDKIVEALLKLINFLGANVGNAKNRSP